MKLVVILFLAVLAAVLCTADADGVNTKILSIEKDGGDNESGKKYSEHKHIKKSEKKSKHSQEKAQKGHDLKELHRVEDEEGGGKKMKFNTENNHKSHKKSSGGSAHGLKYEEAVKHKKNNLKKGFREKYHKDEKKNHDTFYSNSHKSGEYKVFGKGHEKHSAKTLSKKKGGNRKKSKAEGVRGKSSKKLGGHSVTEKKGHQQSKAAKSHHSTGATFGKKGSNSGGKQFHYDSRLPDEVKN